MSGHGQGSLALGQALCRHADRKRDHRTARAYKPRVGEISVSKIWQFRKDLPYRWHAQQTINFAPCDGIKNGLRFKTLYKYKGLCTFLTLRKLFIDSGTDRSVPFRYSNRFIAKL